MGILNVTPDSFYDGGQNNSIENALAKCKKHLDEGASIIDIGGYSSRPGAPDVSIDEELNRTIPVIKEATNQYPECIISIDTFRAEVARIAVENGASIINDISAGKLDPEMHTTVSELNVPYILMHMQGSPQNMQDNPSYNSISKEVYQELESVVYNLHALGVNDLIIDPGFGFGKTLEHNFELLDNLNKLQALNLPVLAGVSRKSMIYKALKSSAIESINGTTALNVSCLENGASILRVHDVKEAIETVKLWVKTKG